MDVNEILQNLNYEISVCLSDIPKGKMSKSENGKIYVNLTVAKRREPDQWKRDLKVYVSQKQAEREAGEAKVYVGAGRTVEFKPKENVPPTDKDIENLLAPSESCDF